MDEDEIVQAHLDREAEEEFWLQALPQFEMWWRNFQDLHGTYYLIAKSAWMAGWLRGVKRDSQAAKRPDMEETPSS